jgi:hypothetical protein
MINIRKILLLSALLMSASSITAPTYAMIDDEGDSAARATHAQLPYELTLDMIPEIRKHGSFLTTAKEYILQNPDQLESFANYLNPDQYSSFARYQSSYAAYGELNYLIQENGFSRYLNPNYDPARPEETGPEWIEDGHSMELSRLIFKEQERTFAPAKPLAVAPKVEEKEVESGAASSVQAPVSSDSSSEDAVKAMIIRSLTETYKSDPKALGEALAAFLTNLK